MTPITLQLFGCGERGLETPVQYGGTRSPNPPAEDYFNDAMPLVQVSEAIGLESVIAEYQAGFSQVDFQFGATTRRDMPDLSDFVEFDEYWLKYASSQPQPVYALTTGSLFYLHDETSVEELLGGVQLNPGEAILILEPLNTAHMHWSETHPDRVSALEECAYLNVQMLNDDALKDLIRRSANDDYFKFLHKNFTGMEWAGTGDWASEYAQKFVEYPGWPLIVSGGSQIATTGVNPSALQEQRISMFFKIGGEWSAHYDAVKTFFKYSQRRRRLIGHPLIAKLLGHSVEAGAVDVIPLTDGESFERGKQRLVEDFKLYLSWSDPAYHPLALDTSEVPHRLIIPSHSSDSTFPTPELRPDQLLTRLKISNPLGLQINIGGDIPAGVSISPTSFSATEQVVEVEASWDLAPDMTETKIEIATADGAVLHEITLTFLGFRAIPVKFWKVRDENGAHVTGMGELRLREAISIANDMLGRQANVYIYPEEENGIILHDLPYAGDLGDVVTMASLKSVSEQISVPNGNKSIHLLFVWDLKVEGHGDIQGVTYNSLDHFKTSVDTVSNSDDYTLASTMVHELGHWFSSTFIWNAGNGGTLECANRDRHFSHLQDDGNGGQSGCPGGDWTFYNNLMASGGSTVNITTEQARVFNEYADEILP